MFCVAAMSGAMMLCTQMSGNPELNSGYRTGGESGSSSSSSDPLRSMVSSWSRSRSFRGCHVHRCFGLCEFEGSARIKARVGRRSSGGLGRSGTVMMRSGGDNNDKNLGDDGVETLFMRELRRRGMSTKEKNGAPLGSAGTDTKTKEESDGSRGFFSGWSLPGTGSTKPPPPPTESQRDEQLKRSQALNSEGLDGLIPRGIELLKLGSSFFLVFWPLILASLAAFGAVYLYFGSAFIHPGNKFEQVGRPPYVDPSKLLEEETIPPQIGPDRVPFNVMIDDSRTNGKSP